MRVPKDLKALWYSKLKETGFEDIESNDESKPLYKNSFLYSSKNSIHRHGNESKMEYYRLANQFLHEHNFKFKIHRFNQWEKRYPALREMEWKIHYFIWREHSDGLSIRKIRLKLKEKGISLCKWTVHEVIVKLRAKMLRQALR